MIPLRKQLKAHIDQNGVAQARIAKEIGLSGSRLSQYLNNKYPGDNPEIDQRVESYLKRVSEHIKTAAILPSGAFVLTRQARMVYGLLLTCHVDCDMGMIIGEPGLGKTLAIEAYAKENKGIMHIPVLKTNTMKTLLKTIAEELNIKTAESNDARARAIIRVLKHSKRMMVIDEAHHLSFPCLEILRQIHDGSGIGLVYSGPEALRTKISHPDIEQINSRIGITATLPELDEADNALILQSTGISYTGRAAKKLHEISRGSGRRAAKTFKRACRVANGQEITETHILMADKQSVMG